MNNSLYFEPSALLLNKFMEGQEEGAKNAEYPEDNRDRVVEGAKELAFNNEVRLETDDFESAVKCEHFAEGDFSQVAKLLWEIDQASAEKKLMAQMKLGQFMQRKWMDPL